MYKLNFIPSAESDTLPIYHPNGANEIDKLIVISATAHLEVNTAGSMTFEMMPDHPYLGNISIMSGILELLDGTVPIFRGRVTEDVKSFYLRHQIRAEGILACLNDSVVEPFSFPEDWEDDAGYQAAAASGNVVQFFLKWLIDSHNAQVGPGQQIKLGAVTVTDPNNYISRSSEKYEKTWATCKDKLFGSSLGGYFLMRYEADGNYLDYVEDFPLTNVQKVVFAENLRDLSVDRDGTELYTAILPVGKEGLTIAELPDESIDSDLVKSGKIIYSRLAEQTQGGRITKVVQFDDVTEAGNLRRKAAATLAGVAMPETISCNACDLHCIDGTTPSFRVGRYTEVYSQPHGYSSTYPLMALDLDILNPGNTPIVLNRQQMSLTKALGDVATKAQVYDAAESVMKATDSRLNEIVEISKQNAAAIVEDSQSVLLEAMSKYSEKSSFDAFQREMASKLQVLDEGIEARVSRTEVKEITDAQGDVQRRVDTIEQFIKFDAEDGVTIGQEGSNVKQVLDNDSQKIIVNGQVVQELNAANGAQYTAVKIKDRLQLGNLIIYVEADGSLAGRRAN